MKKRQNISFFRLRFFTSRKGYTLFELIMVIGIISVFTGVVHLEFEETHRKARVMNAATQALADLRYAQQMAMTQRQPVDFIVDVAGNTYTAERSGAVLQSATKTGDLYVDFDDINDVDMSMGIGAVLSFDAQGLPTYGGASFEDELPVFRINDDVYLCILPSGFSYLNDELYDGSGCGGFGC